MPVTGPCKNAPGKCPQPQTAAKLRKKDFLHDLHRAGMPEETIKAADKQVHYPVDQERNGTFLVTHCLDRDQLISRMGGSP